MTDPLLAGVLENPPDDAPRLVYADWLEENGQGAYAEFVRAGVKADRLLAEWGEPRSKLAADMTEAQRLLHGRLVRAQDRERIVLGQNAWSWVRPVIDTLWPGCSFDLRGLVAVCAPGGHVNGQVEFRRGFVASVTATSAVLFGGPCGRCEETGIDPTNTAGGDLCPACGGSGTVPGCLREVFGSQPVTNVVLSCRRPLSPDANNLAWCWHRGDSPQYRPADLPDDVFYLLPRTSGNYSFHDSEAAALDALSAAICRLGRRAAGLPPAQL